MIDYKASSSWYWLLTVALLTAGVSGWTAGFLLAIGLTVVQLVHFTIRERSLTAFPIQVRLGYLLLLPVALPEPLQLIYWIPTIGTWVQVLFGYWTMARIVSLSPWNRNEAFSLDLLKRTFLSAPVRGMSCRGSPRVDYHRRAWRFLFKRKGPASRPCLMNYLYPLFPSLLPQGEMGATRCALPRAFLYKRGTISSATILMILMSGLIAGPAVSL